MKLLDLQNDESLRQRAFPVCADKIYFAHAGVSPVPSVVTQAVHEVATAAGLDEQEVGFACYPCPCGQVAGSECERGGARWPHHYWT